jgi:copper(I)-binding protein
MSKFPLPVALGLVAWLLAAGPASAVAPSPADAVLVKDAWVRPAVAGQSGTGGYLTVEAKEAVTLTGLKSPVASEAELHEMRMEGDVMQMRAVGSLPIPAGGVLKLAPRGQHLMLMGLKRALPVGDQVPLTLLFKTAKGKRFEVKLQATVQMKPPEKAGSQ